MYKSKSKIRESTMNNQKKNCGSFDLSHIGDIENIKASVWDSISRRKLRKG